MRKPIAKPIERAKNLFASLASADGSEERIRYYSAMKDMAETLDLILAQCSNFPSQFNFDKISSLLSDVRYYRDKINDIEKIILSDETLSDAEKVKVMLVLKK